MNGVTIDARVYAQIAEIYDYSCETWSEGQAGAYVASLFDVFGRIASRKVPWRRIDPRLGINGYLHRHRSHVVYWRMKADGGLGIVAVLHQRMLPAERLRRAFDYPNEP